MPLSLRLESPSTSACNSGLGMNRQESNGIVDIIKRSLGASIPSQPLRGIMSPASTFIVELLAATLHQLTLTYFFERFRISNHSASG